MIVAIDGPAGAGKSTVAQEVARRLGLQYVDTGAIYRTVAYFAHASGVGFDDGPEVARVADALHIRFAIVDGVNTVRASLEGQAELEVTKAIRTPQMSEGASRVSAHPEVREALLELQRRLGRAADSLLEGRDIGTVVFPGADVKVFLTASPEIRAGRRREQLLEKASDPSAVPALETIAAEMRQRDLRDSSREVAPLAPADDAEVVDTTGVPFEEVVSRIVSLVDGGP